MRCKECKYRRETEDRTFHICDISHTILDHTMFPEVTGCNHDEFEAECDYICYNCAHWIGLGDFGLSCELNYYNCSSNGWDDACEEFKRKE